MKYMLMIHNNPDNPWTGSEEDKEGLRALLALRDQLAQSGELVASDALAEPAETKTVRVRNGAVTATDGPFIEAKEYLAGYFVVECESLERAVEIAALTPVARTYAIEVRPVLDDCAMRGEL